MRLLHRSVAWLTDEALADSIVGDLEELRRTRGRMWPAAVAIVWHIALVRGTACASRVARDLSLGAALRGISDDLRHAARSVRRTPGFAAAAILLIALGIGASTAIFSVVHGVALRPLPYPGADRIIRIYEANPAAGKLREDVSEPAFHEWRTSAPSLATTALLNNVRTQFLEGQHEQPVYTMAVSPAFFDVLGVAPALGAGFRPETEYTAATRREVVISHSAWQRLYGGDPAAVGRSVRFADDDNAHRIAGVMPEGFAFGTPVDFWKPHLVTLPPGRVTRNWRYDRVIARLADGATIQQARAELETVAARLAREFPSQHGGWTVSVESLQASVVGAFERISWLLLATVTVVLAVTYLNVGGLLVARSVARQRDTAVRAALGAGGWRLVRLRLAEATLLGGSGALLGVLLAWLSVDALKAAAPPGIPRLDEIALDLQTVTVAGAAGLVAVLVFTLAPGRTRSGDLVSGLRAAAPGAGGTRRWQATRMALTVAQCAGAAALLVLSMLLTRSFIKLTSVDLGWQPNGILSMKVSPPILRAERRPWFRYVEWSDRLVARLESTPGIERAAITTQVPLAPQPYPSVVARGRGKAGGDEGRWPAIRHNVTDGYFDTMLVPLLAGRTFNASDRLSATDLNGPGTVERGVAIVSESAARTLWPGESAIGKILWLPDIDRVTWREVVGVVADIQFQSVGESPGLHVFVPWTQFSTGNPRLLVRASGDAAAASALVRRVVDDVERGTLIEAIAPLDVLYDAATAQPRFTTQLVAGFGSLALLLAAVGIYGTLSYLVSTRRREIGIRLALGATPSAIMSTVMRRGVAPALAGGLAGLAAAVGVARVFRALLFGIEPIDPISVAAGGTLLALVAAAAAFLPAWRASSVNPSTALRSE